MSTETKSLATVLQSAGLPANISEMASAARAVNNAIAGGGAGDRMFGRFHKDRGWEYGPDGIRPEAGSLWAVNPLNAEVGCVCWVDKQIKGEEFVRALSGITPPQAGEQPQISGGDWGSAFRIQLACVTDGADEDVQFEWMGQSIGALGAYKRLMTQVLDRLEKQDPFFIPVVELSGTSYDHKKYGTIKTPEMKVVDWADIDENFLSDVGTAPAVKAVAEPTSEPEPEPEPEPAKEEPAAELPKRRRKTRAA